MMDGGGGGFISAPDCRNQGPGSRCTSVSDAGGHLFRGELTLPRTARIPGSRRSNPTRIGVDTSTMDRAELSNEIIDVVCKEGMIDREKVTPEATIESLDLKSIDIVMILTAIEEKFDVYIPMDGSFTEAKDVQGLIEALTEHVIKEKQRAEGQVAESQNVKETS